MSSISDRARARQPADKRDVAFVIRAKTGPGSRDWNTIGVMFARRGGEDGFTIKLNTLPISKDWNGSLVAVPPFIADEDTPDPDPGYDHR